MFQTILSEIQKTDIKTIGTIDAKNFVWPTTREQSLQLLDFFAYGMFATFWKLSRCHDTE